MLTPLLRTTLLLATCLTTALADPSSAYSTHMLSSIVTRQQGLVSSGQVTSTLESGLVALALQAWLARYSAASSETAGCFSDYVDAMLSSISATDDFTNVSASSRLPLDRLTVAQAIRNLEKGDDAAAAAGGGDGARQLTATEMVALDTLNTSLAVQERNQYGGFWYYVYPNWSYLDGAVSFLPFMAGSASWSASDAQRQITLLYTACFDAATGLVTHGYDASRTAVWANNATGASPYVWGRSLGWYLAGLVNAWEMLQPDDGGGGGDDDDDAQRAELTSAIRAQFTTLARSLVAYADPETGAWWQMTTFPGRAGNFLESSSTALFIFSILKAQRLGLLEASSGWHFDNSSAFSAALTNTTTTIGNVYTAVALRAYDYSVRNFVIDYGNGTLGWNGTVVVCSLNSSATYEYYTSRPINVNAPLGEAAFVLASLEVERLEL